jgi:DNA polymerase-3 subunit chi
MVQFFFINVSDNLSKLSSIVSTCKKHFLNRDSILIFTQDKIAAQFIDDLLWKMPQESFMPHSITSQLTDEKIVITTIPKNLNKAQILINISAKPATFCNEFEIIYELMDATTEEKLKLSKERFDSYKAMNYNLSLIS